MGRHGRRTPINRERIQREVKLYSAMERATTEEEFQILLAETDKLHAEEKRGKFVYRTLADFKAKNHHEGPGFFARLPPRSET